MFPVLSVTASRGVTKCTKVGLETLRASLPALQCVAGPGLRRDWVGTLLAAYRAASAADDPNAWTQYEADKAVAQATYDAGLTVVEQSRQNSGQAAEIGRSSRNRAVWRRLSSNARNFGFI
jgi:hypothetical protein